MAEPTGVLGEIVARKREEVAARFATFDPRERATPTTQSLEAALRRGGARFIMEIKRASPSGGGLRANADPAAIALAWGNVADAISVLTDHRFFGGSLEDLQDARGFGGPILAKDIVIDSRQVAEARLHGADAALIMLSVLDDDAAREILAEAKRLNMDAVVEIHNEDEARRATALGCPLVGVNNRDLRTLKVDLAVTEGLAALIPKDRVLVAESGIADRRDVERLAPVADAFLVGSALMRAASPGLAARALAFGRVKVCGLTNAEDARAAVAAGAGFAGVIFAEGSPRAVSIEAAESVLGPARLVGAAAVGIFRAAGVASVVEAARALGLDAVQLHGREDEAFIAALRAKLPNVEIWAACPVGDRAGPAPAGADRTVFDTEAEGRFGGLGRPFDWTLIKGRADLHDGVLAGGLDPQNARDAAKVGTFALDVGSGVERIPGRKDCAKLRAFFEALRPQCRSDRSLC